MTTHTVETATAAEEAAVFAVLTLAFSSDPATRWTWPDPRAYLEAFPHFAKAFGGAAFGPAAPIASARPGPRSGCRRASDRTMRRSAR